jgi:hypothetical protein
MMCLVGIRGVRAHKIFEQPIIAARRGFDVTIDDGKNKKKFL